MEELGEDDREILLLRHFEHSSRMPRPPGCLASASQQPACATSGPCAACASSWALPPVGKNDHERRSLRLAAHRARSINSHSYSPAWPNSSRMVKPPTSIQSLENILSSADELRELWLTAQIAEDLASNAETDATVEYPAWCAFRGADAHRFLRDALQTIGDCELIEELGRGGMGVVYRAWQKGLGRIVALKVLLNASTASAIEVARFRAEASFGRPARSSAHRAGLRVGDHEGRPYFIMRLIEGQSLARYLADGPIARA